LQLKANCLILPLAVSDLKVNHTN